MAGLAVGFVVFLCDNVLAKKLLRMSFAAKFVCVAFYMYVPVGRWVNATARWLWRTVSNKLLRTHQYCVRTGPWVVEVYEAGHCFFFAVL